MEKFCAVRIWPNVSTDRIWFRSADSSALCFDSSNFSCPCSNRASPTASCADASLISKIPSISIRFNVTYASSKVVFPSVTCSCAVCRAAIAVWISTCFCDSCVITCGISSIELRLTFNAANWSAHCWFKDVFSSNSSSCNNSRRFPASAMLSWFSPVIARIWLICSWSPEIFASSKSSSIRLLPSSLFIWASFCACSMSAFNPIPCS